MKLWLSVALLTAFYLSACTGEETPPAGARRTAARYPAETGVENQPTQQPFNPNAPPENTETAAQPPAPPPTGVAPSKAAKGDYPYGTPVTVKPGFVKAPTAAYKGLCILRGIP